MKNLNFLQMFVIIIAGILMVLGYQMLSLLAFVTAFGIFALEYRVKFFSKVETIVYTLNIMVLILFSSGGKYLTHNTLVIIQQRKIIAFIAIGCSVISNILVTKNNQSENK